MEWQQEGDHISAYVPATQGEAVTVAVDATTTGAPGTQASVVNVGTGVAARLQFTIPRGDPGPAGLEGPAGSPGLIGAQGVQGAPGAQGTVGVQGPQGLIGAQGAIGLTGAAGKTVLYGTSNPTIANGVDGDFWINTLTHVLFGPRVGGTWPAGVSLVGPQGTQGAAGPQGPSGEGGGLTGEDVTITGTMTAATFSGSGSNLTALPASQLTGTVSADRLPSIAHSSLAGISANDHHTQQHGLLSSDHLVNVLTPGTFLKATSSSTFGFAVHGLSYFDVGAAASTHVHLIVSTVEPATAPIGTLWLNR